MSQSRGSAGGGGARAQSVVTYGCTPFRESGKDRPTMSKSPPRMTGVPCGAPGNANKALKATRTVWTLNRYRASLHKATVGLRHRGSVHLATKHPPRKNGQPGQKQLAHFPNIAKLPKATTAQIHQIMKTWKTRAPQNTHTHTRTHDTTI